MKRLIAVLGGAAVATLLAVPADAGMINHAEGKPITITGVTGVITCCFGPAPVAPLSTIVDGVFLPAGTQWQTGTVWWDERHTPSLNNIIEIDLLGNLVIDQIFLQADNNDWYAVYYRDWGGVWNFFGTAGPFGGPGMQTRFSFDNLNLQASGFRIDAFGGDQFYSVSEFQALPEPGLLALLGIGVAGAIRRRVRK